MAVQTRTHTVNCENTFAALLVETSSTLIAAPVARPDAANASVRRFPRRRSARAAGDSRVPSQPPARQARGGRSRRRHAPRLPY